MNQPTGSGWDGTDSKNIHELFRLMKLGEPHGTGQTRPLTSPLLDSPSLLTHGTSLLLDPPPPNPLPGELFFNPSLSELRLTSLFLPLLPTPILPPHGVAPTVSHPRCLKLLPRLLPPTTAHSGESQTPP